MSLAGAFLKDNGTCLFRVWAPLKDDMSLEIKGDRAREMVKDSEGYFSLNVDNVRPGTLYKYSHGESASPDPASFFQPNGVHDYSAVVDHALFNWTDHEWRGLPIEELIFYELHVGTFTEEGTFEAMIGRLDDLRETGINAIELMPICQFPGDRNWGYDAVFPYAVQNSYGGPDGLKKLVNACHEKGIAVFLDVVYNHIGPEGNCLPRFGPYFTDKYSTPWGDAINFDGDWSDGVRDFFCNNALYWLEQYHIDGLRLDAVHMAFDNGAVNFWQYVNGKVNALQSRLGRPLYMIAESDLNSPRTIKQVEAEGLGFSAQWLDDFHHALYVLLDPNGRERYIDFGLMDQLAKAYKEGFVHSGDYVKFRKRRHGQSSAGVSGERFVVFNQNHDQIGNRPNGERLSALVDDDRLKLAAAAILMSPYVPMLFMGEEYADSSPFFYFVSHSDPKLIEAVRKGRRNEFKDFNTAGEMPDPQDENTFRRCKLKWNERTADLHSEILRWHKGLIALRNSHPVLRNFNKNDVHVNAVGEEGLILHRQTEGGQSHIVCAFNFSERTISMRMPPYAHWVKILESTRDEGTRCPDEIPAATIIDLPALRVAIYEGVIAQ